MPLRDGRGSTVVTRGGDATITYTMEYREFPKGARLRGAWCVKILRASNLTVCDKLLGTSDAYATVSAVSQDGAALAQQSTAVVARNLSPTWNECFEFPLAHEGTAPLGQLLGTAASRLVAASGTLEKIFPPHGAGELAVRRAQVLWGEQLTRAASSAAPELSALGGA